MARDPELRRRESEEISAEPHQNGEEFRRIDRNGQAIRGGGAEKLRHRVLPHFADRDQRKSPDRVKGVGGEQYKREITGNDKRIGEDLHDACGDRRSLCDAVCRRSQLDGEQTRHLGLESCSRTCKRTLE